MRIVSDCGYDIQGNTITLAAPPGLTPTIDTGANNATISSILTGSGFAKTGGGTLAVAGANSYNGQTLVNGGQLLANESPSNVLNLAQRLSLALGRETLSVGVISSAPIQSQRYPSVDKIALG